MADTKENIEQAVYEGIRKTVRRFRERPFHYFTEADIHASCSRDMLNGSSDILVRRPVDNLSVSLVHQEYPTNFRYKKEELLEGYDKKDIDITKVDSSYGDRGNFDLAVLNPDFVQEVFEQQTKRENTSCGFEEALKHIINKDVNGAVQRQSSSGSKQQELMFAIEIKFIHLFNARNIDLLKAIIKDTEKLRLARHHSAGNLRVLNLVFCAARAMERNRKGEDKIPIANRIKSYCAGEEEVKIDEKTYQTPQEVFTAFIPSFLDKDGVKNTEKPKCGYKGNDTVLKKWKKMAFAQKILK